jgi:glycosyltransferase involved in cell wall biosynthesis
MEFDLARVASPILTTDRPLRLAFVTETYPPEVNGVARTVARVVEGLVERGHEIQLIRPRPARLDDKPKPRLQEIFTRGCPIPRYPQLKLGFPAGRTLRRLWRNSPPDVVHIATEGPLGVSALMAARRMGVPTVSEFRTNFDAYTRYYGIGCFQRVIRGYLRAFHNGTGLTMVPTTPLARDLGKHGFRNLSTVARGVDAHHFHPSRRSAALRNSWGAAPGTLVAISVGRLAPEKNLGTLAAAYQTMRGVNPTTRLVIVGDGPSRDAIQSACPQAHFAGMRSGSDLATHYASADILLFPSITETFGNVTLEAMASGLAVLAYDYAAASTLIRHGESGLLARYDDRTDYLRLSKEAALRPKALEILGAQARSCAESMDWNTIISQIEGHYRSAVQSRSSQASTPYHPSIVPDQRPVYSSALRRLE